MHAEITAAGVVTPATPPVDFAKFDAEGQPSTTASEAIEPQADDLTFAYVPAGLIDPKDDNPRYYIDAEELDALHAAILARGRILQSCLVVPLGNGRYKATAGSRRVMCAKRIGDDYPVPCLIDANGASTAYMDAAIENIARANMSETEEARAAGTLVELLGFDDTLRYFGRSRTWLNHRLALNLLSEEVKAAVDRREVSLTHAELIAGLAPELHGQVLALIKTKNLTAAQLRDWINTKSLDLATAIFDKSDCASCPHNSEAQSALFATAVDAGKCTNPPCFKQKSKTAVEAKAETLRERYGRVIILHQQEDIPRSVPLRTEQVGETQAKACLTCDNYASTVSLLSHEVGKVTEGLCLDLPCNAQKRKALEKANKPPKTPKTPDAATPTPTSGTTKSIKSVDDVAPKDVANQPGQRVIEYREKVWREALTTYLLNDAKQNIPALVLVATVVSGSGRWFNGTSAHELLATDTSIISFTDALAYFLSEEGKPQARDLMPKLPSTIAKDIELHQLVKTYITLDINLANYWTVNADYLELLTKAQISALAEEIGLKQHLGEAFAKLEKLGKGEFIKGCLAADGFDFAGKLPAWMMVQH
jgi:ParB family chromosome partitioning protein